MPYLFKLSRRMARTRAAFILATALAAAAACESERLLPSGPEKPELATMAGAVGTVSDLRVVAASDTSLTVAFTAVGDAAGLPANYDVRYAASPIGWGSATSVTRGTCAVPLAGGSVGSATACTILGLTRSTKYDVQLVAFSGTLNVNAVFGAPSNVATGSAISPVPSSATVLLQETFEDASFASRGWYDNTALATTTAQYIAGSTRALEVHFLPGATTPTWGGAARRPFAASETVYLGYWVKYSGNWVGSGHTYQPHEFMFLTNEDGAYTGPSFTHLTTYVEHNYQNGGIPALRMQDGANIDQTRIGVDLSAVTENRGAGGCNGNTDGYATGCYQLGGVYVNEKIWQAAQPTFLPNPGTGYKGDWHFVEAYFQLNAIQNGKGVANGIVRYWFDGQLVIDRTNVLLRTGAHPTMKFNQLLIGPYIGDGSPVDQTMWVDNLTVASGRIGAPAGPSVASVTVTPASASVAVGSTLRFGVTVKDASGNVLTGQAVTWASSSTAVATVAGSGLATGVAAGTATITATSGGISGSAPLSVTAVVPVASVTVSPAPVTQLVGAKQQLAATLKDASGNVLTGRTVWWTSSNSGIATVSGTGLESGMSVGTAAITATSGGVSGSSAITVNATVPGAVGDLAVAARTDTSVTLSFTEVNDGTGKPASYDVRYAPGAISWGSASNAARGTCTSPLAGTTIGAKRTCTVLGLSPATAYGVQLIAFRGTLNLNVAFGGLSKVASGTTGAGSAAPVASVSVSPTSVSQTAGTTQQLAATLKDASGNALTGRPVTWASSNPAVASVSGSGLESSVTAGSATVTATSEGQSGTATVTVTVLPPPPPPPPPPSTGWTNQPGGYSTVTDQAWDGLTTLGWNSMYNTNGYATIVGDATAPLSPGNVIQYKYPSGFVAGSAPATEWHALPSLTHAYVGLWWKASNPWQGNPTGVNKIQYLFSNSQGSIFLCMYGSPGGPYELRVFPQFTVSQDVWLTPNVNHVPVTLGQWHKIEWVVDYNGGVVKWWLDGQLIGSYTGIPMPSTPLVEYHLTPVWGGVDGVKSETDYYWYDHVYISGN